MEYYRIYTFEHLIPPQLPEGNSMVPLAALTQSADCVQMQRYWNQLVRLGGLIQ